MSELMSEFKSKILFDWQSPFLFEEQLSPEEKFIQQTAKNYAQTKLKPRVLQGFREEIFDKNILREMGELGLLGAFLKGDDFAGINQVSYGLISREIEYIDSAYRSALSVQSSLVMLPIDLYGSEEQKKAYLPKLAKGELIGCFGLTEANHGSDPKSMETRAKKVEGGYEISGSKSWITHAPIADIIILWAKDDSNEGKVQGFILDKNMKNLEITPINGKFSLRISPTGQIFLNKVFVPEDHKLPAAAGFTPVLRCLESARYGIAWGALGAAEFCFETARNYVLDRTQFSKPLAANQLIQYKLAEMSTNIALGLQACLRVGRLKDEHKASLEAISLIKRHSTLTALNIARQASDMLGANGIIDEYHIIRHVLNLETVKTYEGTTDIHALILGKGITGISAF